MAEIITVKDFMKKFKAEKRKEAIKKHIVELGNWYSDNREFAAILFGLGFITIKGLFSMTKQGIRNANQRHEEALKELTIWDPSAGHRWQLRRKLSTSELLEIAERRADGEKLSDILYRMKVLK